MTPRALLLSGLGLLLLSLLLRLVAGGVVVVWADGVLSLVGSGLVVSAALVSALQAPTVSRRPAEPGVDHYR